MDIALSCKNICGGDVEVDEENKSCTGWFQTAWSPAIVAYERLTDLGFDLDILYHESGMGFAGRFLDGEDLYFEYNFSDPKWREKITDEEVLDFLEQEYLNWLDWQEEDKTDDGA